MGREILRTKIDEKQRGKTINCRGNVKKVRVMATNVANVFDPKTKKSFKNLKILNLLRKWVLLNLMN